MKKIWSLIGWVAILTLGVLFFMLGSAYAQDPASSQIHLPAGLPPLKVNGAWWSALLVGIWGGVQANVTGLMKKRDPVTGAWPTFDPKLLLKTVLIGAAIGVIAFFAKLSPADVSTGVMAAPIGGFITAGAEDLVNLIWKKIKPPATPPPAS
jgi:hypothetical protein